MHTKAPAELADPLNRFLTALRYDVGGPSCLASVIRSSWWPMMMICPVHGGTDLVDDADRFVPVLEKA